MANKNVQKGANSRKSVLFRLIRMLFSFYPVLLPITLLCILLNAIISSIPSIFMQNIIAAVEQSWQTGDWATVSGHILGLVAILAIFYGLSLLAGVAYTQLMAIITQGSLAKLREKMFNSMQDLPIRYFDTHNHGDVMSYYTNDIDTLRQMISQSIPQLIISSVVVLTVLCIMLYYSLWMTLVILLGVFCMFLVVRKIGGNSARYFIRQQQAILICHQLDLPLLGGGGMHVGPLAQGAQDFRRVVLVEHVLIFFPDIDVLLAHAEQDGDVLRRDDVALAEYGVLGDAPDDLGDIVAQHLSHGLFRLQQLHCVCPQFSWYSSRMSRAAR